MNWLVTSKLALEVHSIRKADPFKVSGNPWSCALNLEVDLTAKQRGTLVGNLRASMPPAEWEALMTQLDEEFA